jgi:hypothetical protein
LHTRFLHLPDKEEIWSDDEMIRDGKRRVSNDARTNSRRPGDTTGLPRFAKPLLVRDTLNGGGEFPDAVERSGQWPSDAEEFTDISCVAGVAGVAPYAWFFFVGLG